MVGTALRVLYDLPRFSEDLDFSVDAARAAELDAKRTFVRLKQTLSAAGYDLELKANTKRTVASAFFRFALLPHEAGWSGDKRVKLAIKLEINTNPPCRATTETTLVQRYFPIAICHHDLPSLFAGKLHALLTRRYTKGRDWFDLVWYLTTHRGLTPNIGLLKNALAQSGASSFEAQKWRQGLLHRLGDLDWPQVLADLRPFVARQSDLEQLADKGLLEKLIRSP